jgi:hypothetical protein
MLIFASYQLILHILCSHLMLDAIDHCSAFMIIMIMNVIKLSGKFLWSLHDTMYVELAYKVYQKALSQENLLCVLRKCGIYLLDSNVINRDQLRFSYQRRMLIKLPILNQNV